VVGADELEQRAYDLAGGPFSIVRAGCTGVLLAATNVPCCWRASTLLAPTCISSSFSTSLAAISLALGRHRRRGEATGHGLARAEALCMTAELGCLTAAVLKMGTAGRPLTHGRRGLLFWPLTYVGGLVVPLLLQLNGSARGKPMSPARHYLAAVLPLIGGVSLRTLMIFAGRASADIPEDYLELTRKRTS